MASREAHLAELPDHDLMLAEQSIWQRRLPPQWTVDPPYLLRGMKQELIRELYADRLVLRAEIAQLEAQSLKREAEFLRRAT